VLSLNFSGLEKGASFKFTIPMVRKTVAAVLYGDELMSLSNQVRPYEHVPGSADALIAKWQSAICRQFSIGRGVNKRDMKQNFEAIAGDYAALPFTKTPRVRVGVVGEIYVKYSPLGNSGLEAFLAAEGCEVNGPGLMGFVQYCIMNGSIDRLLYGGSGVVKRGYEAVMDFIAVRERLMAAAIKRHPCLRAPALFSDTFALARGVIGYGAKMGEGWLLTAEMVELVKSGTPNIVCAQPFGCLPNHVVGKGMIAKIRALYPEANITPIDYDPSASRVNQENRIKLMIAVARERLEGAAGAARVIPLPTD
jgi:predicted nucleotide-binding protein (sugar kinase/HSP70/actin superfamily)